MLYSLLRGGMCVAVWMCVWMCVWLCGHVRPPSCNDERLLKVLCHSVTQNQIFIGRVFEAARFEAA